MIVEKIDALLSGVAVHNEDILLEVAQNSERVFQRQFMSDRESRAGYLSLSGCGKCPRQLAYAFHGIEQEGKEIDTRAKITFWVGDLTEYTVVALARLAGCELEFTGENQKTIEMDINGVKVYGHPDGILTHNKEKYLFECKSMSSFGFKEFEEGNISSDYLAQMNAYMDCLGLDKAVMVALNKDAGVLSERVITKNQQIVNELKDNLAIVLKSTSDNLPKGRHEANDKGVYPWNCLYCAWWVKCKPEAKRVVMSGRFKLIKKGETNGIK